MDKYLTGTNSHFGNFTDYDKLLEELSTEFHNLGENAQVVLQQNYLSTERDYQLTQHQFSLTGYDKIQGRASQYLKYRQTTYGWEDMLLIDMQGNVVFSLKNESDFATNLRTGPWKYSGLARAVLPLLYDAIPQQFGFADYSKYAPSKMQAASFIGMPVFDQDKQQFAGVVAIRLPISQMSELMMDKAGMGETGEVIVINKESWMLTDSRFSQESTILKKQIQTPVSEAVLAGKTITMIAPDYRGIEIIARVKPFIPFPTALGDKVLWGIIPKIEHSEILREYYKIQQALLWIAVGLIVLAVSLGFWSGRSVTLPLMCIANTLTRLAKGEQISLPGLQRTDDIGEIARAVESLRIILQQLEHEHWLSVNVTLLTNAVSGENSASKAAERILNFLCELLAVPVGAVYILEEGRYQRISTHGLARSNQAETSFESGVGLMWQCVKSRQALVLSPVPGGLTIISTGLAEFSTHELIIVPIAHKNEVLAVLELAAISSLQAKQHVFLKAVSEVLG